MADITPLIIPQNPPNMNKRFYLYILMAFASVIIISSCSNDTKDDDIILPQAKMVLTEMRGNYVNASYNTSTAGFQAKYDNNGRITQMRVYGYNGWEDWETYNYSDTKITVGDNNESYDLVNGKIVKDSDGTIYDYNSNNQLVKISRGDGTSNLTWDECNIISVEDKYNWGSEKYTLSYVPRSLSDFSPIGILNYALNEAYSTCYPSEGSWINIGLAMSGFFGNTPENLCKSISIDGKIDRSFEYPEKNNFGYPTKVIITDSDGDVQEYTLVWE